MNNSIIKIGLAIVLFLCLLNMPYGYYQFVRYLAMVSFAHLAYTSNEQNNKNEVFVYIVLAILFQPFLKIALGKEIWNFIDVIVSIGLLLSLINKNKNKTKVK